MQLTYTNLDGSQKERGNFFKFASKSGGTQNAGGGGAVSLRKQGEGGSNPGGNYERVL